MSDQDTHVVTYSGQEYEVIEVGPHPHAHGSAKGHEGDSEIYGTYRCFECGKRVTADTVEEAREKLENKPCE